jgi:hypothetical protein
MVRMPGYPALLSTLFWFSDDPPRAWARWQNAALGTLVVALVYWLSRIVFPAERRAAWWAAVAATFYPGAVATSTFILSEGPFCPLLVLQIAAWAKAARAERNRDVASWALVMGAAAAAAVYMRPSWLPFTPFALLVLTSVSSSRWRHLRIGAVGCLVIVAALAPWWIRNYRLAGQFVLTTTEMGASLYDGLSAEATGGSDMRFRKAFHLAQEFADTQSDEPMGRFECRVDERMKRAAVRWATSNPGRVIELMGVKFKRMWSVSPNDGEMSGWKIRALLLLGYTPLIAASILGTALYWNRGWPVLLCWLPAIYTTLLHLIFVSSIRYRQPPMLTLLCVGALLAAHWIPPRKDGAGATPTNE